MAKPPFHRLCGTSHWSTERCPGVDAKKDAPRPPRSEKPSPAAALQGKAVHAGTGSGTPAAHGGRNKGGGTRRADKAVAPVADPETPAGWKARALAAEAELAAIKAKAKARLDRHRGKVKK